MAYSPNTPISHCAYGLWTDHCKNWLVCKGIVEPTVYDPVGMLGLCEWCQQADLRRKDRQKRNQ